MIEVNSRIESALSSYGRQFTAHMESATTTYPGFQSLKVYKGSCGESEFNLGTVFSSYFEAEIQDLDETTYPLTDNTDVTLYISIDTGTGTYQKIKIGEYTVLRPKKTGSKWKINGYGLLSTKFGDIYDGISTETDIHTLQEILDDIFSADHISDISYVIKGNLDLTGSVYGLGGWTYLEAMQIIAQLCGGYWSEGADGTVVLASPKAYNQSDSTTNPASRMYVSRNEVNEVPEIATTNYVLDGITCVAALQDSDSATKYVWGTGKYTYNCEYMNQTLFNKMRDKLGSFTYRPAKLSIAHGNPRLEPWDAVRYDASTGESVLIPCMSICITYDGGISVEINAPAEKEEEVSTAFTGPMAKRLRQTYQTITVVDGKATAAKDTADDAKAQVEEVEQHFVWVEGDGAYVTSETVQQRNVAPGGSYTKMDSTGTHIADENGNVTAEFLGTGSDIYQVEQTSSGTYVVTLVAHLGDYITLGSRKTGETIGDGSVAIGKNVTASGTGAYAEGWHTVASGNYSHAEGGGTGYGTLATTASGNYSHAEGYYTEASGIYSHAEGCMATASGSYSHAEGDNTEASGVVSHAEGGGTEASGARSHSEGWATIASGEYSHAEGRGTEAAAPGQHVFGVYNEVLSGIETGNNEFAEYLEVVGRGSDTNIRRNARTLEYTGNEWIAGTLTQASDERLKEEIEGELPDVSAIPARRFRWKEGDNRDTKEHIGYFAQDVEKVLPELVDTDASGYKSLDYIAFLVAKVDSLEKRIAELEGKK